ncbi:hypothetical protein [Nostoc sp.]|uniref:hypothetical protein n=1 Tax=Nostoc sp. TaxID=1180 RepID=UPI002FFA0336
MDGFPGLFAQHLRQEKQVAFEERNPTNPRKSWVSQSLNPTYIFFTAIAPIQ